RAVVMGASIQPGEGGYGRELSKLGGDGEVEPAVVERGFRRRLHAPAEVAPIRRDDDEMAAVARLAVDGNPHRHGLVHPDRAERPGEIPEGRAEVARAALHALRDDAVDPDTGRVHEHPA